MSSRVSLHLATLGPASIEQKLYAAGRAGFSAVGLTLGELEEPGERTRQELLLSELSVMELEAVSGWLDPGRTARSVALVQAEAAFAAAAEIGAEVVLAWPAETPVEPLSLAGYFGDLCRAADPFGIRIGLEFLGRSATVKDLSTAWHVVEIAEAINGGLVIDTFNFLVGGSTLEMIEQIPAEKIFLVQVSDAPDLPVSELYDHHRLYPGTGSARLESLIAAIRAKGYEGPWSLELHNEEYWEEDPIIVAAEGFRALRRLDLV